MTKLLPIQFIPIDLVRKTASILPGNKSVIYPWMIKVNGNDVNLEVGITSEEDLLERIGDPTAPHGIRIEDFRNVFVVGYPVNFKVYRVLGTNCQYFSSYFEGLLAFVSDYAIDRTETKISNLMNLYVASRKQTTPLLLSLKEANIRKTVYLNETFLIIMNRISIDEVNQFKEDMAKNHHQNIRFLIIQLLDEQLYKNENTNLMNKINRLMV